MGESIQEQIEQMRKEVRGATHPTHDTLSPEPRYECEYCDCVEVTSNCHDEGCVALLLARAANTMENLHEVLVKIANDTDSKCVHVGAAREALLLAEDSG